MSFAFNVLGQSGAIPSVGFGTATLFGETITAAVRAAIKLGCRHIDTALLYNNQEAVGEGVRAAIAAGDVKREELWITSKVAFYPPAADGRNTWVPISFHPENRKGFEATAAGVDLCLQKLGLEYVDLMLIHNPLTALDEYAASAVPHAFELGKSMLDAEERALILARRLAKVKYDATGGEAVRAESWRALEAAKAAGKVRFIGVSNYPPQLVEAMKAYAKVMPAINQLELHPRFSSPSLRAHAAANGYVLTAYGSGNSVALEKSLIVAGIAAKHGVSPLAVVLRWTLQHGVCVIPRTATPAHIAENLGAASGPALDAADVAALDALNEAHCYYWSPLPSLPPGTAPDV